jgi:hypothetical protein
LLDSPQAARQEILVAQLLERHATSFLFGRPTGDQFLVTILEVLCHFLDDFSLTRWRQIQARQPPQYFPAPVPHE